MATVTKRSLSLGAEELAWAQEQAKREGVSLSTMVTEALRLLRQAREAEAERDAAWNEFMSEFEARHEPLTEPELAEAAEELGMTPDDSAQHGAQSTG